MVPLAFSSRSIVSRRLDQTDRVHSNKDYYDSISTSVDRKRDAGFNVSITDVWGVALAYHFGPGGTTASNFYE